MSDWLGLFVMSWFWWVMPIGVLGLACWLGSRVKNPFRKKQSVLSLVPPGSPVTKGYVDLVVASARGDEVKMEQVIRTNPLYVVPGGELVRLDNSDRVVVPSRRAGAVRIDQLFFTGCLFFAFLVLSLAVADWNLIAATVGYEVEDVQLTAWCVVMVVWVVLMFLGVGHATKSSSVRGCR